MRGGERDHEEERKDNGEMKKGRQKRWRMRKEGEMVEKVRKYRGK